MGSTFLASERHKAHSWGQIWGQLERDSGAPAGKLGLRALPQRLEKKVARGRSTSWSRWIERGASIQPREIQPLRVNRQSMRGLVYTFPRKQIGQRPSISSPFCGSLEAHACIREISPSPLTSKASSVGSHYDPLPCGLKKQGMNFTCPRLILIGAQCGIDISRY